MLVSDSLADLYAPFHPIALASLSSLVAVSFLLLYWGLPCSDFFPLLLK